MSDKNEFVEEIPARELPLSTVENTPPLMLDLPDGQQLVVGKLPDGIVIEIATWRGTGRPDSRTNRMMLGVSYDEDDVNEETPKRALLKRVKREPEIAPTPITSDVAPISTIASVVPVESVEMVAQTVAPIAVESETPASQELTPLVDVEVAAIEEVEIDISAPIDIDAAVNPIAEAPLIEAIQEEAIASIVEEEVPVFGLSQPIDTRRNMQDLFGARPRAQLDEVPRSPLMERGHEIVRRPTKKRKAFEFNISKLIKPAAALALSAFGIFFLVGPAGLRFTLPEDGLRTSMSSAANALVIVRKSENYQIGDSVVAAVQAPGNPDYFASIAAQSDIEYVLTENNLYHTALREDVRGKVLLVMPGIGFVLHKIGL
jgi:hypothetical protein